MMFRSIIAISVMILTLTGCIIYVEGASHAPLQYKQVKKRLDTQNLHSLIANVGAGQLDIKGVAGLKAITVTADIYYHEDNAYVLTLKNRGEKAELIAKFAKRKNTQPKPYIDLSILVPAAMALTLNDGSGAAKINNVTADIHLNDGSGNISIVGGHHLQINDGSGSIAIKNSSGNTQIIDGSGDMSIQNIIGNITIDDGSGDINVHTSQGNVTLGDGSGDINIHSTKGLTILSSSSGEVNVDNIDGPIRM
ncbi:DUF4097 domain-containing protein [Shewanella surugensis]|uniref:DUF4097 domain-containing protein n=1 Tax=Shewanella surugensis TaxID=212020 RepID=A0ABT0L8K2_9GAMM|nr:DUF4097 domain-containing protein [Shewanella surugensis]MCL1124024.1 DUF4097 domain-containing protein [Shewanella surugensis]